MVIGFRHPAGAAPAVLTAPAVGRISPPAICSRVDFPHPDGPMIARISPSRASRSMPSSTARAS